MKNIGSKLTLALTKVLAGLWVVSFALITIGVLVWSTKWTFGLLGVM